MTVLRKSILGQKLMCNYLIAHCPPLLIVRKRFWEHLMLRVSDIIEEWMLKGQDFHDINV